MLALGSQIEEERSRDIDANNDARRQFDERELEIQVGLMAIDWLSSSMY